MKRIVAVSRKRRWITATLVGLSWLGLTVLAVGGSYRDSAHGDPVRGVDRSIIDARLAEYATGNCAHCHEMHASIEGSEPEPRGGAAPRLVFFNNFNTSRAENPYFESDNFCFFCHSEFSGQQVRNQDYSAVFGGATAGSGPQSILEAFNLPSYHNLYDIWNFLRNNLSFPRFNDTANPCAACHNPHLAKRNHDAGLPGFPLLSAISRPNDPDRLWGESELMADYDSYEAPYAFAPSREPAGVGLEDGDNTPNYAGFCSTCHNQDNNIWSTTLNRHLKKINWGLIGDRRDKHGTLARDGADHFREPYAAATGAKNNFVLSCLDCHEPHGSENILLLRRRVNGENLEETISALDITMGRLCQRCHTDDLAAGAGTGEANRWEYIHHDAPDAPYIKQNCGNCHGPQQEPISCGNCHGHGMTDIWAGTHQTGRQTF
jgi:hypothetical protein